MNLSVDLDDITAGKGSLPRSGGHERPVHSQCDAERGRVQQPCLPEKDRLQRREVSQGSLGQTDPTGWKNKCLLFVS